MTALFEVQCDMRVTPQLCNMMIYQQTFPVTEQPYAQCDWQSPGRPRSTSPVQLYRPISAWRVWHTSYSRTIVHA